MLSTKKTTNLTWFDVTFLAEMFSNVIKFILTGGKNENYR